jgi:hypothetical protein
LVSLWATKRIFEWLRSFADITLDGFPGRGVIKFKDMGGSVVERLSKIPGPDKETEYYVHISLR